MKTTPPLRKLLREAALPPTAARPPEAFWSDFRARARYVRQEAPGAERAGAAAWAPARRWAAAGMACALLAAGAGWWGLSGRPGAGPMLQSLRVLTAYDSVFILKDDANEGTIVWVSGLSEEAEGAALEKEARGHA